MGFLARRAAAERPANAGHFIVGMTNSAPSLTPEGQRCHRLGLGRSAPRQAVLVEVAEAGALPAAEGVVGERHRDNDYAYRTNLDAADKSRAASPSRVKMATPLPYSCSDGSRTFSS
jgi:hypothetical protein